MNIKSVLSLSLMSALLFGCSNASTSQATQDSVHNSTDTDNRDDRNNTAQSDSTQESTNPNSDQQTVSTDTLSLDLADYFSDRDLEQSVSDVQAYDLINGQHNTISTEGIYSFSGSYSDTTIVVDAGDQDKVQLVLDNLSIENRDFPAIYVKNADKVFVTLTGDNFLSVSSAFVADGDTNTDAVIFSRDDLTLNGNGSLTINSSENGISGKDEIRFTGGVYTIDTDADSIEANERIAIADGTFMINSGKDALHSEYDEDLSTGDIIIFDGTFDLVAADDGIQATTDLVVENGNFTIQAAEGMESTNIIINNGVISITASDDGINAAQKASVGRPVITINGGDITINMGMGDTDAIDSNGDLYITGGTLDISAQSAFDYDGTGQKTGGTIYVNGSEVTQLTNSMMGGRFGKNRTR